MASKKAATAATTKIAAPKGFRKVETTLAGFWKPELPGQAIQGVVGQVVSIRGVDGKENEFYTLKITDEEISAPVVDKEDNPVQLDHGSMIGVGGKMLLTFLREHTGKEVHIVYRGLGIAKKGQNPPKMFDTFAREERD